MQSNGDHFRQSYLFILNVTWMEGIAFKYQDSSVCFAHLTVGLIHNHLG